MALYDGDAGGGRHGPYWRRQLGTTHPGEANQQQFNQLQRLRKMLGLPPLDTAGPDNQRFAAPRGGGLGAPRRLIEPLPHPFPSPGLPGPRETPGPPPSLGPGPPHLNIGAINTAAGRFSPRPPGLAQVIQRRRRPQPQGFAY